MQHVEFMPSSSRKIDSTCSQGIRERLCHYVQRIVHLLNNNSCHITGPRRDRHLTVGHQVLIWAELSIMRWILSELLHGKIRYIN